MSTNNPKYKNKIGGKLKIINHFYVHTSKVCPPVKKEDTKQASKLYVKLKFLFMFKDNSLVDFS